LSKLIADEFNRIIESLQQEIKFTEGEILKEAQHKFGLKAINLQIAQLRKQIEMLNKRKEELGFDSNDLFTTVWNNQRSEVKCDTPAGRFYYLKIKRHADIQSLLKERDNRLKRLWLTDIRKDVASLANQAIKPLLVEKK